MENTPSSRTGIAYDPCFTEHVLEPGHPESPERLHAVVRLLKHNGIWERCLPVAPVTDPYPYLAEVHSLEHIASVKDVPTTGRVAAAAAATVLGAVRDVCSGTLMNAFCAVRPPGHHAHNNGAHYDGCNQGQGFCFYNSIAVAARYAQRQCGCRNILIVDWDFHHGNGTEWAFSGDDSILFCSMHNRQSYPGPSGETGKANCIDIHFSCGCTGADIAAAWDDRLQPRLETFKPDLILLSAGFDSREDDPLGCYAVTDAEYRTLTLQLMSMADRYCNGRIVSILEGGYDPAGLASAVTAHIGTLIG